MGLNLFRPSSKLPENCVVEPLNPDPKDWEILRHIEISNLLVVQMRYPNCKNYEGKKILVYKDLSYQELSKQKLIDPHFAEDKISPIARFAPTELGWCMAVTFALLWRTKEFDNGIV